MRNKNKQKSQYENSLRDLINEIHSQGMLLNVEDSIINTNIKSDLFYIKNKMKQSQDIRDQVKAISDSFKISTEIDVWKNYHKWGEIFDSYEKESNTNTLLELVSFKR